MLHVVVKHGYKRLIEHLGQDLQEIKTWPLSWPSVNTLLVALFVATVALFMFRLGALLFLGAIAISLYRLWQLSKPREAVDADGDGN